MLYTPLTNRAMILAYNAHHGQLDRSGIPYIFHPIHLAEQMTDEISCCAALLHDVIEDTSITLEQLRGEFPEEVVTAVALLTHRQDVDYFDYVRTLKANPVAKKVKLADLAHNSDQTRCTGSGLTEVQLCCWKDKYIRARAILEED